jgi:DNA-binding protein HU-beta
LISIKKYLKMFKADLINEISSKTGATKVATGVFIDEFFKAIFGALKKGDNVSLIGFGGLKVVETKAKTGRNPKTGETIKIPAGKKVKFIAGKDLKESVK